jgi:hypothetical protein
MNKVVNKKTMSTLNTQLTLLAPQCLLEVDARSSRKSHKNLKKIENNLENHKSLNNVLEKHQKTK